MTYSIHITNEAHQDMTQILNYLNTTLKAPEAASAFLDEFETFLERVKKLPEIYPLSSEERLHLLGYRKTLIKKYLVLYRTEGNTIYLARVFHSSQDYARLI